MPSMPLDSLSLSQWEIADFLRSDNSFPTLSDYCATYFYTLRPRKYAWNELWASEALVDNNVGTKGGVGGGGEVQVNEVEN